MGSGASTCNKSAVADEVSIVYPPSSASSSTAIAPSLSECEVIDEDYEVMHHSIYKAIADREIKTKLLLHLQELLDEQKTLADASANKVEELVAEYRATYGVDPYL